VKFGCPTTPVASIPLLKGGTNNKTRESPLSTTNRFPVSSKVRPLGFIILLWRLLLTVVAKSGKPNLRLAACPFEKGGSNLNTRQLPPSDTHKFPALSKVTLQGMYRPDPPEPWLFEAKSCWPNVTEAD